MFDHLNKCRVLVTGASSGIGASIAEIFGSYGAIVGLHYHTNEKGASIVAKKIQKSNGAVHLLQGDLTINSVSSELVNQFVRSAGGIDILINCAGAIIGNKHFLDLEIESWNATYTLNVTAPFLLSREAFRYMKEHNGGKIIMISSISAKYGGSETSIHYGAAKAGLEALTRTLSRSGANYNILVNTVQAGVIETPLHKKIGRVSIEDRISKIPLKRAGKPEEVAMLCVFLASNYSNYITGQVFGITGGE
jgi:3-oxoacyl-[acyl-carrier protein] reductase